MTDYTEFQNLLLYPQAFLMVNLGVEILAEKSFEMVSSQLQANLSLEKGNVCRTTWQLFLLMLVTPIVISPCTPRTAAAYRAADV